MIIGDSVLVYTDEGVKRPSDIGKPVEVSGSWTVEFNNGVSITIWGSPEFKVLSGFEPFGSMTINTSFGVKKFLPFIKTEKWETTLDLSDYTTGKTGKFNINDKTFAKFSGFFLVSAVLQNGLYVFTPKNTKVLKESDLYSYVQELFPKDSIDDKNKTLCIKPCWVTELLDAIYNISESKSLPDDIIINATQIWLSTFIEGLEMGLNYDPTVGYDVSGEAYKSVKSLLPDLALVMQRLKRLFSVTIKGEKRLGLKFNPSRGSTLAIINGWENTDARVLYDIGKGEFNVSGIKIKG